MILINCQWTITLFIENLDLFIHNLSKGEYYLFSELMSVEDDIATADAQRHIDHLNNLSKIWIVDSTMFYPWRYVIG